MSEPDGTPDFDLDEDLFSFEEVLEASEEESEKVDLDELLRVLEDTTGEAPDATEDDAEGDEPISEGVDADTLSPATPATAGATVAAAPALSSRFARLGVAILAGLALLNVVQIGLSWERNRDLSDALLEMESRFLLAAGDLQQDLFHQSEAMERNRMPVVAPSAPGRSSLEFVEQQLESGDFRGARRRLYSLLSVLDRYDSAAATQIEANASYLLAESWRLQAEPREEVLQ